MDEANANLSALRKEFRCKHQSIVSIAVGADLEMQSCPLFPERNQERLIRCEELNNIHEYVFDAVFVRLVLAACKRVRAPVTLRVDSSEWSALRSYARLARFGLMLRHEPKCRRNDCGINARMPDADGYDEGEILHVFVRLNVKMTGPPT